MEAICLASSNVISLFFAAAPSAAGSWFILTSEMAIFKGLLAYLMLGNSSNLRVHGCNGSAQHALEPNTAGIALKGSENKSICLPGNVTSGLCICERLVGCCLVQTIGIGNFPLSAC